VTTTKKRVLALDVSTKAGWCVLDSDEVSGAVEMELVSQGLLMLPKPSDFEDPYPWSYIKAADAAADILVELIVRVQPDAVVVEETNLAKARYTQKLLEFLHYALIHRIGEKVSAGFLTVPVFYLSSMVWRQKLGLVMTKADKGNNKLLKQAKAAYAAAKKTFVPQQVVSPRGKVSYTKPKSLQAFKKELGIVGKVDAKDLAVRFVNERFGLNLEKVDNDVADAVCIATAFAAGARHCDGRK
jgi:hypothetical protein